MTDLEPILQLWRELESSGAEYILATVVAVEGSSYRCPGARMIIAQDGRRVGTVSGGCLEADVARRAWWLTSNGPVVERFSTLEDDGDRPYGSGCGGVIFVLLERKGTACGVLRKLQAAFERREPIAIASVLSGSSIGIHAFAQERDLAQAEDTSALCALVRTVLNTHASIDCEIEIDGQQARVWMDYRSARPGLWIFGAGDDAKPLVRLAHELGWFISIADGRSHLATRERFPTADITTVIDISALPGPGLAHLGIRATDAAVVMTHSFEQDSRILAALLSLDSPLAYVGALGPQRRTREMLAEAARLLDISASADRIAQWLAAIHAPTGLDLGAETPAAIALSILAEIQQTLHKGTARPLSIVRATQTLSHVS